MKDRYLRNIRRHRIQVEALLDLIEQEARSAIAHSSKHNLGGDTDAV